MASRVTDILGGSYNLGIPGSSGYFAKTNALVDGLSNQLLAPRTTRVFGAIDPNGSATGGSGDGTQANPYIYRHANDLKTHYSTLSAGGDVEMCMRRGQICRPDLTLGVTSAQGLTLGAAKLRLNVYGPPSDAPFEFTAFVRHQSMTYNTPMADSGDGQLYTAVFTTTAPVQLVPLWVRVGSNMTEQLAAVYSRAASEVAMPARSWYYKAATKTLYINRDAAKTDNVLQYTEIAVGTGDGVLFNDFDLPAIVSWRVTGWGLQTDTSQNYQLRSAVKNANVSGDFFCEFYWSSHHVYGHLVSGGGNSGGTHISQRTRYGLGVQHATGMTGFISFVNDGLHECVLDSVVATHGALRTNAFLTNTNGTPWYLHTGSTTTPAAFRYRRNCSAPQDSVNGWGDATFMDCIPAVAARADLSQYRDWAEGDSINWTLGDVDGFVSLGGGTYKYCQYYRCDWEFTTPLPAGASRLCASSSATGQARRCRFQMNSQAWSGKTNVIFGGASPDFDFIDCVCSVNKQAAGNCFWLGAVTTCRVLRSICQSTAANFTMNIVNTAPTYLTAGVHTGGFSDCAKINLADVTTLAVRMINLAAVIDYSTATGSVNKKILPAALRNISTGRLTGESEYTADISRRVPRKELAGTSIGPVEHWANIGWKSLLMNT